MRSYHNKKIYQGDPHDGDIYRRQYLESLLGWINKRYEDSYADRDLFMTREQLLCAQEDYRQMYLKMIGSPVEIYPDMVPNAKKEYVSEDDFGKIYRVQIEVMPDFWFYGILMVPPNTVKAPLVIAQHGGWGTPETCSDFAGENNYVYFTKRALERGMVVFAPQLLLWSININTGEKFVSFDIPFDRGEIDRKLKHLGLSITGMEVFSIRRSIDYLQSLDCVDGNRIGMMGASYGGYFSLYTAAADPRIKSIYAAAFFNDRTKVCINDWMYKNSALTFGDAEVAGLCAPRRLQIDVGAKDNVFDFTFAETEAKRVSGYYETFGAQDQFRFNYWSGGHRFDENGSGFDFFFSGI